MTDTQTSTDTKAKKGAVHLTTDTFQKTLDEAGDTPVFVDFFAVWCGPCQMAAPIIEQMAEEYDGKAIIAKVDVDQERDLAMKFQVMSIPTFIVFKNGEVVEKSTGFSGKQGFTKMIDKALAQPQAAV